MLFTCNTLVVLPPICNQGRSNICNKPLDDLHIYKTGCIHRIDEGDIAHDVKFSGLVFCLWGICPQ